MIEVENLTKYYGPKAALVDVSFSVKKGEIVGLLGPNAAGKTTAMRIITGFMPPTSGRARVAGYDVVEKSLEVRKRIGYMPEMTPLYTDMSVREYLSFMGRIKGVERGLIRERVDATMRKTALTDVSNTIVGRLSKGYRQRVGLAQAMIHNPDVLILDEPTAGFDPKQQAEARLLIKSLAGEHTVILSTHILTDVSIMCSRVIIIDQGKIAAEDTPENLTRKLKGADRIQLLIRGPEREVKMKLAAVEKVTKVEAKTQKGGLSSYAVDCQLGADVREKLASTVVAGGWGLVELRREVMSLEDIFLQLTTEEAHV
ncbi:MAG: ATP-binding cassette domain-containing protein [Dehalococcoidia bacterium]|nr:ATP-binding cassette domain-containing protein [Dehalococcoidia bacterium]